jgi:hypothetical protein
MHFYGDIFRANFFDLKNSIIRQNNGDLEPLKGFGTVLRIHMFLGLQDPDPDPLVRGMDPDPDPAPDPSIIMQK